MLQVYVYSIPEELSSPSYPLLPAHEWQTEGRESPMVDIANPYQESGWRDMSFLHTKAYAPSFWNGLLAKFKMSKVLSKCVARTPRCSPCLRNGFMKINIFHVVCKIDKIWGYKKFFKGIFLYLFLFIQDFKKCRFSTKFNVHTMSKCRWNFLFAIILIF
jgi:hypothetical protein